MLTLVEENETRWKLRFIRKQKVLIRQSCPTLCDPWTVVFQAPLSMEFSRQEYWCEDPFPSLQGALPNPAVEPWSCALQADSGKPRVLEM